MPDIGQNLITVDNLHNISRSHHRITLFSRQGRAARDTAFIAQQSRQGEAIVNTRNPHDLHQIRPSAELDTGHPHSDHGYGTQGGTQGRNTAPKRRRSRPPRERREGWSFLTKALVGIVAIVALLGAGIAAVLIVASPTELVRNEMIRQVKVTTGRDLQINGRSNIVFYPSLGVSLGNVRLSGPPGMSADPTLTADRIDVSVALMPLLSRKVRVEHVSIVRPVIDLHVDRDGRQSWQFAQAASTAAVPVRVAQLGSGLGGWPDSIRRSMGQGIVLPSAKVTGDSGLESAWLQNLELGSVSLTKASVVYRDDRSGTAEQIDNLDLSLRGKRISDPLRATGALDWQRERLNFDARLDTVAKLLSGQAAKAEVKVSGKPLNVGFDGTVNLSGAPQAVGQTSLSGRSLAAAARWLGQELPHAAPLGGFTVTGQLKASPTSVALNGAKLSLGQTRAAGSIQVALAGKRPRINADLKVNELDIDRLTTGFSESRSIARGGPARRPTQARPAGAKPANGQQVRPQIPSAGNPPKSIEDLLRRSENMERDNRRNVGQRRRDARINPQVRGYTNRNEWSAEPIDVVALGLIDAKTRLHIDGLRVSGVSIGRTVLRLALADRLAQIDIDDLQLYGGAGKGVITIKPAGRGVSVGTNLTVNNVAARALFKDAADFDQLDGRGNLQVQVRGTGNSQKAIANSLNGRAQFVFKDGAIVGWNMAKILRGVQSGRFSNFDAAPNEKTDFSELAASFNIASGRAVTKDLRMLSPLLRVTGQGYVGVGRRDLNLSLRPRLVSSLHGQGAQTGASGLEIPVKVKGPWHDPRVAPDFGGITQDPSKLLDQAKRLGGQLQGRNVGDVVRGVLGGNRTGAQGQTGRPTGGQATDILKNLFGQ